MKITEVPEMTEAEELLAFIQQFVHGYSEGMRSYGFDPRYYLAGMVMEAWFLYVKYELRPTIGEC
jgi:hypothetical protein